MKFKFSIFFFFFLTEVFTPWFRLLEWPFFILWYSMVDSVNWITWSPFFSTDWADGRMLSVKNTWLYSSFTKFDLTEPALTLNMNDKTCISSSYPGRTYLWERIVWHIILPLMEVNYCVKKIEINNAVYWSRTTTTRMGTDLKLADIWKVFSFGWRVSRRKGI